MGEGGESERLFLVTTPRGNEPVGAAQVYVVFGLSCGQCGFARLHRPDVLGL
jgi:hypothetical protein